MVKVNNKKTIHLLTNRFIKSHKKSTLALVFAISLMIALITSLLTLIHTNHKIEAQQNQFIYTNMDYQIADLTTKQINILRNNSGIAHLGIRSEPGSVFTGNNQSGMLTTANEESILAVSTLLEGNMPKKENEIVAERWALLNLGINPAIGSTFSLPTVFFDNPEDMKNVSYKLVGILSNMASNKMGNRPRLYTGLPVHSGGKYFAEIKFKNTVDMKKEIDEIKEMLNISSKQITPNPWNEKKSELLPIDAKLGCLLIVLCVIIVWGIYRISLIVRENHYGILRAVGVTKLQIRKMLLHELLKLYVVSIPIGIAIGVLSTWTITWFSKDTELKLYFWGKEELFKLVYPIAPITICIACIGIVLIIIALVGSRKINKADIMSNIIGLSEKNIKNVPLFKIKMKSKSGFLSQKLGGKYIFCDFKTTLVIIISLAVGGSLFYGLAYKSTIALSHNTVQTQTNFYNSDYLLTTYDDMNIQNGITEKTLKNIKKMNGISSIETQMAMPVKVTDDNTPKSKEFFNRQEEIIKRVYNFSLTGKLEKENVYHTKLKGYNQTALEKLSRYIVTGSYDPEHIKENEIIVSMPRISSRGKSKGSIGFFKNGIPVMQYKVGQTVCINYRSDFDTSSEEYWKFSDKKSKYTSKKYKIAAIVYYPYMKEVSPLEQSYPLFITSDENYKGVAPDGTYETINVTAADFTSPTEQTAIEENLIRLAVKNQKVTARSLIEEKRKIDMMYQKQMVYIYGIAVVTFILILINLINHLKYRIQTRKDDLYIYKAVGMEFCTQSNMICFENLMFGILSLGIVFFTSQIISKYLYSNSELYLYGISYQYNYLIFSLLTIFTMLICFFLSKMLSRSLKHESILEQLNKIE